MFYGHSCGNVYLALKVSLPSGMSTKLANLSILKKKKGGGGLYIRVKRENDLPFWKFRKLGSLGNLSEGEVKFLESGENDIPFLLYKGEKGGVIFSPINSGKNQSLDFYRIVERVRHVAAL